MGDEELRLSDADRNRVAEALRHHTGEGRLSLDEFADRVEIVYAARTRSDLAPALAGLPDLPGPMRAAQPAAQEPEKRNWVVAIMGASDRKGRWRVGRHTTAFALMGAVTLDLRGATIDSGEIEIKCWSMMGAVDVIVPEGFPVDFDGFVFMGGRDERLADVPPVPGAPTIRVRGYGFWGAVTVRSKPPRQPGRKRDRREKREQREQRRNDRRGRMIPPLPQTPPIPPMPPIPDPLAVFRSGHRHGHGWWGEQGSEQNQDEEESRVGATRHLGTVTILVTDIVSSTAHAERLGDQRWLAVLQSHNALVREQLTAHGGNEVKQSGDGFLATFSSARDAVRAGLGIRRSIDGYRNSNPQAPLVLRIGVHAGEVETDGDDVFGVNVSTADRVACAAEPGEILVSGVVRDLADSTSDLRFGDSKEIPVAGRTVPLRVHRVLEI